MVVHTCKVYFFYSLNLTIELSFSFFIKYIFDIDL